MLQVDIRARAGRQQGVPARRRGRKWSDDGACESPKFTAPVPPSPTAKPDTRWREQVGSTVVEHAWETLCGSIIQEVGGVCTLIRLACPPPQQAAAPHPRLQNPDKQHAGAGRKEAQPWGAAGARMQGGCKDWLR